MAESTLSSPQPGIRRVETTAPRELPGWFVDFVRDRACCVGSSLLTFPEVEIHTQAISIEKAGGVQVLLETRPPPLCY